MDIRSINFTSRTVSPVSFKANPVNEGLILAEKNFERFRTNGNSYLNKLSSTISQYSKNLSNTICRNPDYLLVKNDKITEIRDRMLRDSDQKAREALSNIYIPHPKYKMERDFEQKIVEYFDELSQKGDKAAKVILYARADNSGLSQYELKKIPELLIKNLETKIIHWGQKITYNGEDLITNEGELEKIKPELEKHLETINSKVDEFYNSEKLQQAEDEYKQTIEAERQKIIKQNSRSISKQRVQEEFGYHQLNLQNETIERKKEAMKKCIMPTQLKNWTSYSFSPEYCNPKKLVLSHPLKNDNFSFNTVKAFHGEVRTNSFGDLIMEFPDGNKGYFKDIEFIRKEKGTSEEYYKIIEAKPDGTEEIYTLVTGSKTNAGKYCAKIICNESGNETIFEYGKPVPFVQAVKKPVIAFRNFTQDTKLDVNVDFSGEYKVIYPKEYTKENKSILWTGTASDNKFIIEDKKYPYLFWDGILSSEIKFGFDEGYCVSGKDSVEFLEKQCYQHGLDETLTTDFVTFWAPFLQENDFTLVRFLSCEECDKVAKLSIKADNSENIQITRFYMIFKAVENNIKIKEPEQSLSVLKGCAPKVFDWGGFEVG